MTGNTHDNANAGPTERSSAWLIPVVGSVMVLVMMATLAAMGGGGSDAMLDLPQTILPAAGLAGLWLAAAWGFGWLACAALGLDRGGLMQGALGICALLFIDAALGRLGVLQMGGTIGAWAVTAIGVGLLVMQIRRQLSGRDVRLPTISPLWLAGAPALAVLLLAACSSPGWLWATEFGGFDALSYHLQLPKEWIALGAIAPVEHNVYSFLPGYVEGAFYHLMLMRGDAIGATEACQVLHSSFAILAALVVCAFVRRALPERESSASGIVAALIILGTPWIIVCGSLAYNDVAVVMLLGAGMLAIAHDQHEQHAPVGTGLVLGTIIGTACACKLTAAGFVAAPLLIAALMSSRAEDWLRLVASMIVAALVAGAPYLIGNWIACGNPVFPFATGMFGSAHWTSDQVAIWNSAHTPPASSIERITAAWNEFARFGFGAAPGDDPWRPQWSLLPWIGVVGLIISMVDARTRRWGARLLVILLVQLVFWLVFTHIKSRFMLPAAIPLAAATALGGWAVTTRLVQETSAKRLNIRAAAIAAALFIWCLLPAWIYLRERDGEPTARIGWTTFISGDAYSEAELQQAAASGPVPTTVFVNRLLPRGSRVLFLGEATPFYYGSDRIDFDYQTTFDRGPMSEVISAAADDPQAWFASLHDRGYTHLLIDPNMLARWQRDGWADPALRADDILNAAIEHGDIVHHSPTGTIVVRLR